MQAVEELNKVLAAFIALQRSVQRSSFEAVQPFDRLSLTCQLKHLLFRMIMQSTVVQQKLTFTAW